MRVSSMALFLISRNSFTLRNLVSRGASIDSSGTLKATSPLSSSIAAFSFSWRMKGSEDEKRVKELLVPIYLNSRSESALISLPLSIDDDSVQWVQRGVSVLAS